MCIRDSFRTLAAALSSDVDAVCIATSTDSHLAVLKEAVRAGKHILCEKPVSLEVEMVDEGLAMVDAAGVLLQVGFNRRFDPGHKAVADAVADGSVGEPQLIRITSRHPAPPSLEYIVASGGIFTDMSIHDFDMARYVTQSDVVEVYAAGAVLVDAAIGEVGDIDSAAITLTHADGAMTQIDNSRQAVYGYDQRVEVFGSKGVAVSEGPTTTSLQERYADSYVDQWRAFAAAAQQGTASPVSGADGRASLVVAKAAALSFAENRPVRIDELDF